VLDKCIHSNLVHSEIRPLYSWKERPGHEGNNSVQCQGYECVELYFHSPLLMSSWNSVINSLTPNDEYSGRTAPLTSKRCILYIYSTNIGTEYFKHGIYSPIFFSSKCSLFHKSNVFCSYIIHILYTGCAKIKKNNSGAKRLINWPINMFTNFLYINL